MMWREMKERMEIIAKNPIRVFAASYWPRYGYPYKLQHCEKATDGVRDSCYELIIDSNFEDPSVSNEDVIKAAEKFDADIIIPKDFVGQPTRTLESTKEFLPLVREADTHAKVWAPIQPPYADHYAAHADFYSEFSHFALGGLQQFESTQEQIDAIEAFREVAGEHVHVHGFGVGTSLEMVKALRRDRPFLDSIDISTAERALKNSVIPDKSWKQTPFYIPQGTDSTTVRSNFASAVLIMLNYMLGPQVDDDVVSAYHDQTTLGEVQQMVDSTQTGTQATSKRGKAVEE
ncbi:hypothetical protein SAMN05216388_102628 [Halorientalis persicus]|uniref:tRNA-guanine(15) transglycosylase-like domain-containing protein n=1 Tax=Halorientalis persicus TaxID=1367881 RepID=A0A1H8U8S6_9EURY|nr:hypothetical protein [Halorientalis persicus]SEO99609.1 hypothetical protein SAMN05216388_102628 [Halorientalis persicus]